MLPRIPPVRFAVLAFPLLLLGAGPCAVVPIDVGLPDLAGALPVTVSLPAGTDPAAVGVALDGADARSMVAPEGSRLVGWIPVPDPGAHRISVSLPATLLPGVAVPVVRGRRFDVPASAPAVVGVEPADGAVDVPRSAWLRVRLVGPVPAAGLRGFGFAIACDGRIVPRTAHPQPDGSLILNPTPELPPGTSCRLTWRGHGSRVSESRFQVAPDAAGAAATALYDRTDPLALAPFPDDYWVVPDAAQPSGRAIDMPVPPFTEAFQAQAFEALVAQTLDTDGWSRMPPIVVAFSHAVDPAALPADAVASLDPLAPIWLVDVDPASPDYGARIPYRAVRRSDEAPDATDDHVVILFPGIDLREQGRYALVVSRRVFAAGEPGRPFGPSAFFAAALAAPAAGEAPEVTQARDAIGDTLATLAALPDLPIPLEDVALALQLSIRTTPDVTDLVAIKERALAAPPPALEIPSLDDPCPDAVRSCIRLLANRALEVRGFVRLPDYRNRSLLVFERDPVTGLPVQTRIARVPFRLTLPLEALDGPVPIVMYQHGNPGSPAEVSSEGGTGYLDDAGYAVAGIQDTLNREIGQDVSLQVSAILFFAVQVQQLPDYWNQTGADMIGFLRAIQGMGALDLMHRDANGDPAIGADGIPEIDPSRILYHGISEGGNNAQRFLPFAPEIIAATPTVGGARLGETLIHQSSDDILEQIGALMPELRPVELWVGLSLFQLGFDRQDGHTFLRHLYREPLLPFAGSTDTTPPSSLWTEGVGDSLVPNNASRSMAIELGIPHVRPIAREVPSLEQVDAPLAENLAPGLTAGYFQYDPATTPYCIETPQPEGHYCPQRAPEAQSQRRHFLESALEEGAAEIVSPF